MNSRVNYKTIFLQSATIKYKKFEAIFFESVPKMIYIIEKIRIALQQTQYLYTIKRLKHKFTQ